MGRTWTEGGGGVKDGGWVKDGVWEGPGLRVCGLRTGCWKDLD